MFIAIRHRYHLAFLLLEHEELSIANLADSAHYFLTILQLDALWEGSWAHATIRAVLHGTELTLDWLLENGLTGEAVSLFLCQVIAWSIILHFKLKDDLIWVKCVRDPKYADGHNLLHLGPLVTPQSFVLMLYRQQCLIWECLVTARGLPIRFLDRLLIL